MPLNEEKAKNLHKMVATAPFYQLLKITLEKIDEGLARFRMPFQRELTQGFGVVHGGAIATLADTAVAYALLSLVQPGERVATVEFKINYLSSVTAGELIAEAHIINKGEKLALGGMEVKNEQGKLIAKGLATYMILKNN
jgi:acyl-CoA thioesterase